MANATYDKWREAILNGGANVALNGTVKVTLVDGATYTPNLSTHDFIDDVIAGARISTQTLANKTFTLGVFDADDVTFTSVTAGTYEYLIIWIDTGTEATSRLVAIFDTATGLAVTSSGGNVIVTWDSGANKIFKL
jgi:hypothetical protein